MAVTEIIATQKPERYCNRTQACVGGAKREMKPDKAWLSLSGFWGRGTCQVGRLGWNAVGHDVQIAIAGIGIAPDDKPVAAEFDDTGFIRADT